MRTVQLKLLEVHQFLFFVFRQNKELDRVIQMPSKFKIKAYKMVIFICFISLLKDVAAKQTKGSLPVAEG